MRKLFLVKQIINQKKTAIGVKERKPLEIYFIGENRSELLYNGEEKLVYRTSGLYGNEERVETANPYGVVFTKRIPLDGILK